MKPIHFLLAIGFLYFPLSAFSQLVNNPKVTYTNMRFQVNNLGTPNKAAGAQNDPYYGDYFWEFGDGNYSTEQRPEYQYAAPGNYVASVHLTPFYSHDLPLAVSETVLASSIRRTEIIDEKVSDANLLHIFSNANGRLVPGNEIQLVLHYQTPSWASGKQEGFLLLFFNQDRESNLNISPFSFPEEGDARKYYGEQEVDLYKVLNHNDLPSEAIRLAEEKSFNHDVLAFECPAAVSGRSRRLFISLKSNEHLGRVVFKKKQKKVDVSIKAMWIPKASGFDADRQLQTYTLTLLNVHDPNKMTVRPRTANYKKGSPQELEYEVQFQNKGRRAAREVTIEIPWSRNLSYSSVEVVGRNPDQWECRECPKEFDPYQDRFSCFKIDTTSRRVEGKVLFTFYNISLHGTKEDGVSKNKYTKGNLVFRVKSNDEKQDLTSTRASIIFEGAKPLKTNRVRTEWRQKTLGLRPSYNMGGDIGILSRSDNILKQFNLGVYLQNAPVKTGMGWGVEAGFNNADYQSSLVLDGGIPHSEHRSLQFSLLDVKGEVFYQLGGTFKFGAGGGLSTLLSGSLEASAERTQFYVPPMLDTANPPPIVIIQNTFSGSALSRAGLLVANSEGSLFNQPLSMDTFSGWFASFHVEAGLLNTLSAGLNYEYRHYPKFYSGECSSYSNFQLFLRFKLFAKG